MKEIVKREKQEAELRKRKESKRVRVKRTGLRKGGTAGHKMQIHGSVYLSVRYVPNAKTNNRACAF